MTADVLAKVTSTFQQSYPLAKITVVAMPPEAIVSAVANGDAHLGLGFDFALESGVTLYSEVRCSLGVVVRPDHPIAGRVNIHLGDCLDHPFVLPMEDLTLRTMFDRSARKAGVSVEPILETNSIDLLKRLAMLSDVVTVLTRADVALERLRGSLAFVPFRDEGVESQRLMIVHRSSAQFDGLTARFAERLADLARQIGDGP
jgi:DNA-binding transcriptional LysR family regulator